MKKEGRTYKSLLNAKINLFFYLISLFFAFFSRKIFLDNLGAEFIGLTGTLTNILGFLNIAELGIASIICFFLYKPLQENNQEKIKEIVSLFGFIYKRIGAIIALCGVLISLFFPLIFKNTILGLGIIYFAFFSFLGSSLVTYFINYRQVLLTADQKNYIVAVYFQTANLLKTVIQITLAYYYKNLFLWVAIEFIFSVIACIILNRKIDHEYPWLKVNTKNGKTLLKVYPEIFSKTKQFFIHKMKDFFLYKSDEILVFAFVSLKMVAYYGNYLLIINKILVLVNISFDSMNAGVGNLIAEGNKQNTMKVFWELTAIRFFITGSVIFVLFFFMESLMQVWLGKEYILDSIILYLLIINLFIMLSRGVVEIFIHAHGLYGDTWVAWTEVILNISITLVAAYYLGIPGILLGKIGSVILIALLWKPYYLFKKGLEVPFVKYWKGMAPYYLSLLFSLAVFFPLKKLFIDQYSENFFMLTLYAFMLYTPFAILFFILLYKTSIGMKHVTNRIPILNKIFKQK
ncbi:sugar transporter [Bacteroides sp. OttesenSCG-928-F21]|nr:sugar transporter [Bacteroides sp. OttesenSCG-928-F21]